MAEPSRRQITWTNHSVLSYAKGTDPIEKITEDARSLVINAIDEGWSGPPFDPLRLAQYLNIEVQPKDDIRDARTLPTSDGKPRIEYNPNRPHGRRRYSIAHEIAHTLFPDCLATTRHRAHHRELTGDEWQLEALCNIAAAEFLMPIGSLSDTATDEPTIDRLLERQREFQVSTEALFIRIARITPRTCAIFCASQRPNETAYKIDYVIPSRSWPNDTIGSPPAHSAITECIAIGYTAKNDEQWSGSATKYHVESVGIPPYPGAPSPRVLGVLTPKRESKSSTSAITYLKGDATLPGGNRPKFILHVVNDKTPNWGGNFARALKNRWPQVQDDFRTWTATHHGLHLGNAHLTQVKDDLTIASMIAQKGYGPSTRPRIRYAALHECLHRVATLAREAHATVHMPRIGAGQAGGAWEIIEELIEDALATQGVQAYVYDPPDSVPTSPAQPGLTFRAN